jgi:hypothetical protein
MDTADLVHRAAETKIRHKTADQQVLQHQRVTAYVWTGSWTNVLALPEK